MTFDWRTSGHLLYEVATLVRANVPTLTVCEIEFEDSSAVIRTTSAAVVVSAGSSRHAIHQALADPAIHSPHDGDISGPPAVFPDTRVAVFGELLYDLGSHAFALDTEAHPCMYRRITLDGDWVLIEVSDAGQATYVAHVSLTSPMPLIGMPYTIMSWITEGRATPGTPFVLD